MKNILPTWDDGILESVFALVSLKYLSVIMATKCLPDVLRGICPSISMVKNSEGPIGGNGLRLRKLRNFVPVLRQSMHDRTLPLTLAAMLGQD